MDSLEQFALNGGYLTSEDFEEIPKTLTGLAYWQKQFSMMAEDMKEEVDMVFTQIGIAKYVPRPFRYILVIGLFLSPIIVLISLLCCCFEDEVSEPVRTQVKPKVNDET